MFILCWLSTWIDHTYIFMSKTNIFLNLNELLGVTGHLPLNMVQKSKWEWKEKSKRDHERNTKLKSLLWRHPQLSGSHGWPFIPDKNASFPCPCPKVLMCYNLSTDAQLPLWCVLGCLYFLTNGKECAWCSFLSEAPWHMNLLETLIHS